MSKKDGNTENTNPITSDDYDAAESLNSGDDAEEIIETGSEQALSEKSEAELLHDEINTLNSRYLRLMADYDNFRKRSQKEKDDIYPSATAAAVLKFLPVIDNLERASQFERSTDEFAKGFDMILQSFHDVLGALGVEEVGEAGEPFDPAFHNAAMHIEDENLGQNVVSQVFQKGYKIGSKVIRYAMVQTAN